MCAGEVGYSAPMIRGRTSWWLSLLLPCVACGDDTSAVTESPSTTDSGASTTDETSTGTPTTAAPTTAVDPTTGGQTASDSGTTTTDETTTTTGDPTTDDTTTTTGEPVDTDTGTTGECAPGGPGPDGDGDTVPDACDACPAGDDLVDGDGDAVADACDACPAGDDALDGDGDGIADACDQCGDGDDAADMDGDMVADACDVCPADPLNDGDGDGVCDGEDACLAGPNDVDVDMDGVPDACDDSVVLAIDTPIDDYDVAGDGALVIVRAEAGALLVTCFNGDASVRRPEFQAGSYDPDQGLGPKPEIHIARAAQTVLVTWFDRAGAPANHRIAYSLLDAECQPIATSQTAIAQPDAYFEFHNSAIDAAGHSVISVSPNETLVTFVDAAGLAGAQQQAFDIDAVYGDHVALNQATGEGILAAQVHSGNGIYYRRFAAGGAWIDPGPVQVPVNYHYWYDGFTVGMNDHSEFVFLWRSDGTALDMRFFAADGTAVADVQRPTIDFEGWDGGHCYDSFRRRHQEIPLRGDEFVLGEVYNWITPQNNRTVHHFAYTPLGEPVSEDSTETNLDEGLTIRVDQLGRAFLRGPSGIEVRAQYP